MKFYENIQQNLSKKGINVTIGTIYDMMAVWKSWYRGNVNDFHYYNVKMADGTTKECERLTMNLAKKSCEDFSKLVWSEKVEIKLDNDEKTEQLDKILNSKKNALIRNLPDFLEETMFALGTGVTVEYYDNGEIIIDYISGDVVLPYKFTNSYIYGIITISREIEKDGEKKIFKTLLTYHEFENNTYTKLNEYYLSDNEDNLGKQVDFNSYFPNVQEYEVITTETPRFQIWCPLVANNFDTNNPMGISIFANQIDKLKAIDTKYDSFTREFKLGKKRILVDKTSVKKSPKVNETTGEVNYVSYFDTDDEAYVAISGMENQPVKDIDFSLRYQEHISSINAELNYFSSFIGLGNNYYKFDGAGLKTATEVISENSDTYRSKIHHQVVVYDCLYDMIKAICEMAGIQTNDITIVFDDSIIEDENALIERGRNLYKDGLISKEKFMKKYLHYEDSEIEEELLKIQNENKIIQPEGIDFFGINDEEQNQE